MRLGFSVHVTIDLQAEAVFAGGAAVHPKLNRKNDIQTVEPSRQQERLQSSDCCQVCRRQARAAINGDGQDKQDSRVLEA